MKLDLPYVQKVFDYNPKVVEIREHIKTLDPSLWTRWGIRQMFNPAQAETDAIPILWTKGHHIFPPNPDSSVREVVVYDQKLNDMVFELMAPLTAGKPHCYFTRAMVVNLPAGRKVGEHSDSAPLHHVHRFHFPVITDPAVRMVVDGNSYFMEEGCWYEFDNVRLHSVYNESNIDRIHIIADYFDPTEDHNF